jgi:hypothetical protein
MTYQKLIETLLRMDERYLKQQVCYSRGEDDLLSINAVKITHFTYHENDETLPEEGHFVLTFD